MKIKIAPLLLTALALAAPRLFAAASLSQYGITWTFDKDYPTGQFCNGDYWVAGSVRVVGISTSLHAPGFTPKPGEDGSMVNPGTTDKQGYDNRLKSYDASLNAGLVNGQPVSPQHPLTLTPNSSLVSMVSWLYRSPQDAEPGIPRFNGGTQAPRPVTRAGAVLTVLPAPAPKGSFRPPYCGAEKSLKYNASKLDYSKLKTLPPVPGAPNPQIVEKQIERPWIDHVNNFLGAMVHPSENMPNYGREITQTTNQAALLLLLDFSKLPGGPSKEKLLIEFVQYGIDLAGIADNGGGWPNNGGHQMGRKWPILFAGLVLNDEHLKNAGQWKTSFQEDEQTFYVAQANVELTHSPQWKPDRRGDPPTPYETADIGMPEWGVNHTGGPRADNRTWNTPYRSINGCVYPGFVLAARLKGQEAAWNHQALFDYTDRYMSETGGKDHAEAVDPFILNMWKAYNPAPRH